jgi:site-specific DNA-methyltransferase (adenine-specific)
MKNIPDESIDLIVTDPPYGIDFQSCWTENHKRFKKILNDKTPFIEWIKPAFDKLKGGEIDLLLQMGCTRRVPE